MHKIAWRISRVQKSWVPLLEGIGVCRADHLVYKRFLGLRIKKQLPLSLKIFTYELESDKMGDLNRRENIAVFRKGQNRCLPGHVFQ